MDNESKKIVIFEKDHDWVGYVKSILSREGHIIFSFNSIADCLQNIDQLQANLLILGPMDEDAQMLCVNALMAIKCRLPLLLIAKHNTRSRNLATQQCRHVEVIRETFEPLVLRSAVKTALGKNRIPEYNDYTSYLVGNSPDMLHIKRNLTDLGQLDDSVLIMGESGTGKEAVARAVHGVSEQNVEHFIKIDAKELNTVDSFSLLFEFKKRKLRPGGRKWAEFNRTNNRWSIYLDEIGHLPQHLQAELLLFAEKGNSHFRIIAGTSQDMEALVGESIFRKDLFYRLNVICLKIPPLRYRKQDIEWLSEFFFYKYYREFDKAYVPMHDDLKEMYRQYHWPGNTTELKSIVKQTVQNGSQHSLFSDPQTSDSQIAASKQNKWAKELMAINQMAMGKDYLELVGEMALKNICSDFKTKIEKQIIRAALKSTNWNRKKAASALCISYKSMLNKIKAYRLA